MRRARGWVARGVVVGTSVYGLGLAGCNHASQPTAPGCCDKPEPVRADASESRGEEAGTSALAGPRFRKEEGCARDFQANTNQREDVALIERLCAQGMAPLLAEPLSTTASGGVVDVPFQVATAGCLRAAAVSAGGALSVTLVDPRGGVLSAASSTEPVVLAPVDGTVCVREPGAYRAVVRPVGRRGPAADETVGASQVTVQIWQAYRD